MTADMPINVQYVYGCHNNLLYINSLCESTMSANVTSRSWPLYTASVASETFPHASSCHVSEFPASSCRISEHVCLRRSLASHMVLVHRFRVPDHAQTVCFVKAPFLRDGRGLRVFGVTLCPFFNVSERLNAARHGGDDKGVKRARRRNVCCAPGRSIAAEDIAGPSQVPSKNTEGVSSSVTERHKRKRWTTCVGVADVVLLAYFVR